MRILCLIKQVPDSLHVPMGSDLTLQREFTAQILNHADESAVELALRLRDAHGGSVTALTMGPARAEGTLRELVARGVDRAALLSSPACAGADTWATSSALCAAVRALGDFDLVLFGRRAADGETGQVGPMTSALLGLPCISNVTQARLEEGHVVADQLTEEGIFTWQASLPAALTLCEWSYPLRLPTLCGLSRARSAGIIRLTPEGIGLRPDVCGLRGSPTRVIRVHAHTQGVRNPRWICASEAAEVVARLLNTGPEESHENACLL